jgi:septal ring factor EnvC (AmiA/AmiB activator)
MASVKSSVFKKIIFIIFIIIIAVIAVQVSRNFNLRLSKISSQFENTKSEYEKVARENRQLTMDYNNLQAGYARLEKDFKASVSDRENMLFQIKSLLPEKARIPELEATIENLKKDI